MPADGRVKSNYLLQVDQSSVTGESLAVNKCKDEVCYASSVVKRGEAYLVVTATGDDTFMGQTAALVNSASSSAGHFTEVLNHIGDRKSVV